MANDDNHYRGKASSLSGSSSSDSAISDRSPDADQDMDMDSNMDPNPSLHSHPDHRPPLLRSPTSERLGRPALPKRKSSAWVVHCNDDVGPHEPRDDERTMSPRRTSTDIEAMQKESKNELKKHAQQLQEYLMSIFRRIEAVQEEHDKLDKNNRFLQKYIGDLMSTSKITATGGGGKGRK